MVELVARARSQGWIVVHTNGAKDGGLLDGLPNAIEQGLSEIADAPRADAYRRRHQLNLAKLYTTEWERADPQEWQQTPSRLLYDLVVSVQQNQDQAGVLLSVDEISAARRFDLVVLGNALQDMMRVRGLPLQFRGASLPHFRRSALNHRDLSFFRRCDDIYMPPISVNDARQGFRSYASTEGGDFASDALELAARATCGSPYMFQLIGYHSWNASRAPQQLMSTSDVRQGIDDAAEKYITNVAESTWRELTDRQQQLVMAMARHPSQPSREALVRLLAKAGVEDRRRRELLVDLVADRLAAEDPDTHVFRLIHGSGLTPAFLQQVYEYGAIDVSDVTEGAGASTVRQRSQMSGSARNGATSTCGKWMPRANCPCALPTGHAGGCRSSAWRKPE